MVKPLQRTLKRLKVQPLSKGVSPMLAEKQVVVKLTDEQQALINWAGIELQDARAYTPKLVAVMDLEDAITLAKAVLAFAEPEALSGK
jgi:hypothetical protein